MRYLRRDGLLGQISVGTDLAMNCDEACLPHMARSYCIQSFLVPGGLAEKELAP
jgi:hypothetical protein